MNTTKDATMDRPVDTRPPVHDKPAPPEKKIASQNELNLIREILIGPTELLNEGRLVELVRMIEEHEDVVNKRLNKMEAQIKKLATISENNQVNTVAEIGGAMVAIGQKVMDLQEKIQPLSPITKP